MSYDGQAAFRIGENRPVFCTLDGTTDNTTITIVSGTFTLYDPDGLVVLGPVNITGNDGASTAPKAWYVLDTTSLTPNVWYVGRFDIVATYSDSVSRPDVVPEIVIFIGPNIEASYDETRLTSVPLYMTRLHAADTNIESPVWSDAELLAFLSETGGLIEQAAAKALLTEVTDKAKQAFRLTVGNFGDDETVVHDALLAAAARLQMTGRGFPIQVNPPDRIFTFDTGTTLGSTHLW